MEAMQWVCIVHCASMVWFDVKSDQQPVLIVLVAYITCKHFPLFVSLVVTCMHKDLQNKGDACARALDSDSRKLNWRRTVSWAILNNSRSEVLVKQSCTACALFLSFTLNYHFCAVLVGKSLSEVLVVLSWGFCGTSSLQRSMHFPRNQEFPSTENC